MKTDLWFFLSILLITGFAYFFSSTTLSLFNSPIAINQTLLLKSTNVSNDYAIFKTPNNSTLNCSLAITQTQQETGLMYQKSLCPNCCMLFVFQNNGIHSFWMKNTLIPLDEVFLNQSFNVVEVYSNFLPCPSSQTNCPIYTPSTDSVYTMEINSGQALSRNLTVSSHLTYLNG